MRFRGRVFQGLMVRGKYDWLIYMRRYDNDGNNINNNNNINDNDNNNNINNNINNVDVKEDMIMIVIILIIIIILMIMIIIITIIKYININNVEVINTGILHHSYQGCAIGVGFCAGSHLDLVLTKLEQVAKNQMVRKSTGLLGFMKVM